MRQFLSKFAEYTLALTIFCSIGPFFVWEQYRGGIGVIVYRLFGALSLICMVSAILINKTKPLKAIAGFALLLIFAYLSIFTGVKTETVLPLTRGNIATCILLVLVVLTNDKYLAGSFDKLKTILTFVFAYTFLIYILVVIGIPFPSETIETFRTQLSGQHHINYLGCLFLSELAGQTDRFTSMFEEPGVVGTISALILATSDGGIKRDKRNIVFLISGLFSLSLAFICMMTVYYLIYAIRKGMLKTATLLIAISIMYIVFENIDFSNELVLELQTRIDFRDEDAKKRNSRIGDDAQSEFDDFLEGDFKTFLMGHGVPYAISSSGETSWSYSATYKKQIFQCGLIGFCLYFLWMVIFPYQCCKTDNTDTNVDLVIYVFVFLISVYQRPFFFSLYFLYFLVAGCARIQRLNEKQNDSSEAITN